MVAVSIDLLAVAAVTDCCQSRVGTVVVTVVLTVASDGWDINISISPSYSAIVSAYCS